jgi:type IV pilus biogenesis protein PilP
MLSKSFFVALIASFLISTPSFAQSSKSDEGSSIDILDKLNAQIQKKSKELELKEIETKLKTEEAKQKNINEQGIQKTYTDHNGHVRPVPRSGGMAPSVKAGSGSLPVIQAITGRSGQLRAELMYSDGSTVRVRQNDRLPNGKRITSITRDCVMVGKKRLRFGKVSDSKSSSEEGGEE